MLKKFEINRTKIKGGCRLGRKVLTHNSKNDLPQVTFENGKEEIHIKYAITFLMKSKYINIALVPPNLIKILIWKKSSVCLF